MTLQNRTSSRTATRRPRPHHRQRSGVRELHPLDPGLRSNGGRLSGPGHRPPPIARPGPSLRSRLAPGSPPPANADAQASKSPLGVEADAQPGRHGVPQSRLAERAENHIAGEGRTMAMNLTFNGVLRVPTLTSVRCRRRRIPLFVPVSALRRS